MHGCVVDHLLCTTARVHPAHCACTASELPEQVRGELVWSSEAEDSDKRRLEGQGDGGRLMWHPDAWPKFCLHVFGRVGVPSHVKGLNSISLRVVRSRRTSKQLRRKKTFSLECHLKLQTRRVRRHGGRWHEVRALSANGRYLANAWLELSQF